jgi:hypothetical protein
MAGTPAAVRCCTRTAPSLPARPFDRSKGAHMVAFMAAPAIAGVLALAVLACCAPNRLFSAPPPPTPRPSLRPAAPTA